MSGSSPAHDRDRVIADTGWGIKPDDQPSNTREAGDDAPRVYHYTTPPQQQRDEVLRQIMRAQRKAYNTANRVIVSAQRTTILDINNDAFVVEGLGYGDDNLIELLQRIGAAFNAQALRQVPPDSPDTREYNLSRVWAWGAERTG